MSSAATPAAGHSPEERRDRRARRPSDPDRRRLPCAHRLFEAWARRTPDADALRSRGQATSYAALNARANQLARRLRALGVGPETRVGLCVGRSPEMVVGLLAVLKAGGAYVPIDPEYPRDRLAFLLRDARVPVLLTQEALLERLPDPSAEVLCLDRDWPSVAEEPDQDLPGGAGADNLAYVIYTSGSTGKPKGAMIVHRGLTNYLAWAARAYAVAKGQGAPVHSSISFDLTITGLLVPLIAGRRVDLLEEGWGVEPLVEALRRESDYSLVKITPAHLQLLARQVPPGQAAGRTRAFVIGGEQLTGELTSAWQDLAPETLLINEYGPTETVVGCCVYTVPPGERLAGAIPIGKPIANTRLYILDRHLEPVPVGVAGELYIGGEGVARGYLDRPALTAEKFVPDRFGPVPGGRLYRTGDLARRRGDGNLEYLGRIDDQVKIRGHRIEPGEVEAALRRLPGVRDAVVVAREDAPGDRRLVAYLEVLEGTPAPSFEGLRGALEQALPAPMIPSAFVPLESFPLTPNGKVDRAALPAPEAGRLAPGAAYEPPRTATEEAIAAIWATLLGLERVGILDNFFALGGHSLLATQVVSRVRDALGVDLPLRKLFEAPTVAGLAALVDDAPEAGRGAGPGPPLERIDRQGALPLSFAQERLWFLDQWEPGDTAYNIPAAVRLSGRLDVEALHGSLAGIVARHEVLRASFVAEEGRALCRVAPALDVDLPIEDLAALPPEARAEAVRRIGLEEARRPFDLARGPLLRPRLLRLGDLEHVFLLTMHHIVSDGWSVGIFVRELAALYQAAALGRPAGLPELPVQYADYAHWQRLRLSGAALEGQLAYWRKRLEGAPAALELPTDRPRPPRQTFRGGRVAIAIPARLSEGLADLGRRHGATPFMTLLAAFQVLLSRLSGQSRVSVGTPIAGRDRRELEGLLGVFVNTLVLSEDLSDDPTFDALLDRVRESTLDAYAHQDLPFEQLVEHLRPARDLSRTPLFQALFALQNAPMPSLSLPGLRIEPLEIDGGTAKFDLTLDLTESGAGLAGTLEYNADLFDAATAGRMAEQLRTILEAVVADPRRRIADLPILGESESRLLAGYATDSEADDDFPVHRMFEAQAALTPDAVAVGSGAAALTYARLESRANRLARHLQALGAGPETLVALCVDRSPEMVVALLAILKAGSAYVPLDPEYPLERLASMIEDSRAPILLTEGHLLDRLPGTAATIVRLDAATGDDDRAPAVEVSGANLAYVIYTSGSTGKPKGVQVTHAALGNFLRSFEALLGISRDDTLLAVTTLSFDIAALELYLPLVAGARVEIVPRDEAADGPRLIERIEAARATFLQATPATWRLLLASGWQGSPRLTLLCGGEALPRALADRLLDKGAALWNLYGPTETTIWSSADRVGAEAGAVAIGRPIAETQLHVLDARLRPVPVGVTGELYIGGSGLARGYLRRPGLTAERFLPDPVGDAPGARIYRTGDLARRRPDGRLECLGRIDHQVKVRGFRVELGEVEAAMLRRPGIRAAAAEARGDASGEARLVAYLVLEDPGASLDLAGLRRGLLEALPEHMVPSAFVVLDALPLTPNGKVDRKALPDPGGDLLAREGEFVAPRTPAEALVAGAWSAVLGVDRVGALDNFFALGGHSLLATQAASRLRAAFGVEVPLRALFEAPTLAALAGRIEAGRLGGRRPSPTPIRRVEGRPRAPLSDAQRSLWFLDQLAPGQPTFNMPAAVRIRGPLDPEALARGFAEIVRRHDALRTTFAWVDGEPVQVIAPDSDATLEVLDLRDRPLAEAEAEAERLAIEEARRPFDLARGPLVRAALLRLGDQDHALLLTMHHIISDGWSFGVAARELGVLYEAFHSGRPATLPDLPIQYADFAEWQRDRLRGEVLDALLGYWTRQLAGVAPLELPTDRPRPAVRSARGAIRSFALPPGLSRRIEDLGRREGATTFMVLLAAFKALLHRYSGQDDFAVGSPIAGRNRAEVEDLVGYFVNMLVLRTDLSGDPAFRDLLGRVREVALGGFEHQDLPLDRLVEALRPPRDLSRTPLFQVMFVLQNNARIVAPRQDLAIEPLPVREGTGMAKFDLTLAMHDSGDGLLGGVEYDTDLFDDATIARLIGHFQALLEAIVADPEAPLSRLAILGEGERRDLLARGRPAASEDREGPCCVHASFEARARLLPDAEALADGALRLSYGELNRRANRLAHHLRALGVGPEVVVAIGVATPSARLEGLLGVLKAGGAYLPLDPSLPGARLSAILADAAVSVLLVDEATRAGLPAHDAVVVSLDGEGDARAIASEGAEDPAPSATPANLAYVIATSGSLGRPKVVMVSHASLAAASRAWEDEYDLASRPTRHLQMASFAFDVFTGDWVRALGSGGTLVACPREVLLDPEALHDLLARERVDCAEFVPAVIEPLIAYLEGAGKRLDTLRLVVVGSDLWHAGEYERLRRLVRPDARVLNSYGLTEATIDSTLFEGSLAGRPASRPVPIGRPLPNTRVYVLDRGLEPVPVGVPGELHVAGPALARGYYRRPGLTARSFVPDPFAERPGGRLYKSGDLARWLPDGNLEVLGRIDHQVKVRGFRVELAEVEAALAQHPEVREAAARVVEDGAGERRLVAYTVARGGSSPSAAELRRFLQETLPRPMIPSAFVALAALPLTPSGKVDRKALPDPAPGQLNAESGAGAGEGQGGPPRDPLEEGLAQAWAEVLGLERVGILDNFFELGGHSLQAVQLVARIANGLGRKVSVKSVLQAPTVAEMAEVLRHDDALAAARGPSAEPRATFEAGPADLPRDVTVESRPLLPLFASGEIAAVDSVALGYFPSGLLGPFGLDRETIIRGWCDNRPVVTGVRETPFGRIGSIMIPRFDDQLYDDRRDLIEVLLDALRVAGTLGARTVSLTGLLPSATDYGRTLAEAAAGQALPAITTGHATTTSAVVLAIRRALEEAGRSLAGTHVGFVGLGSVGVATLRLMLSCLPHPATLTLCDVYQKQDELLALRAELAEVLGFRGEVRILKARREVPEAIYDASLIVGASNVPEILEVARVRPGTILVDDSAPHAFRSDEALARIRERGDILATEGGVLSAPTILPTLVHLPDLLGPTPKGVLHGLLARGRLRQITGCVLSGLLSAKFDHLPPTVGLIDRQTSLEHYRTLDELGFEAADLHLDESPIEGPVLRQFRARFGDGARPSARSPLVALGASGDLPPLFCVHPIGGNVVCYRELALRLGDDRPTFALQAEGIDDGVPEARVESMARRYVEAILEARPGGPYHLLGWSFGGVVAFEMARQLAELGRPVGTLALIDCRAPRAARGTRLDQDALLDAFIADLARGMGLDAPRASLTARTGPDGRPDWGALAGEGRLPPWLEPEALARLFDVFRANVGALEAYEPGVYPGPLTLFRGDERKVEALLDPTLGWSGLALGGVSAHALPGDHYALLRPPALAALAAILRTDLAARDSPPPAGDAGRDEPAAIRD